MRKHLIAVSALAFAVAAGAGAYSANVQANAEVDWANDFKIVATSVRLGDGSNENPTGLRFMVNCPVDYSATAEDVKCYTLLTLTPAGGTQKTVEVPATVWRPEGNIGWNTVVLGIPPSDYLTEITATSYVKVGENDPYASNTVTYSMAKTASLYMQQNNVTDNATLNAFVAGSVSKITLDQESATVVEGDAVKLSATTEPVGFGVTYSSSDESVATVDNTGKVVMQKASGSATITASMGGAKKDFTVTSGGMAKVLHFDNGVNNYITAEGGDTVEWAAPRASAEGNVAAATATGTLKYDPGDWDFYMGIDAAYLASVFADEAATALEYKMYTTKDGLTTKTSNAFIARSSAGGDAVWAGLGSATDMGDYLLFKITRDGYNKWLALHADNTNAGVKMLIQMRLGILDNNSESADYGKIVWGAVDHVYLDDFQASYPTGDFEDGDASFIGSGLIANTAALNRVNLTTALVTENGNTRLSIVSSNWDMAVIIDDVFLARIFADSEVNGLQFKVYCDNDGYCNGSTNGQLCYMGTDDKTVRATWGGYPVSDKTAEGYFTITIPEQWYNDWLTAKGDVVSDMYIQMRLGNWNESTQKYAYANPTNVYLDDFVAVK